MAEGSGLSAFVDFKNIPLISRDIEYYVNKKCIPGGTNRNWDSYGEKIGAISEFQKAVLADPQTSGGLLVAVDSSAINELKDIMEEFGLFEFHNPVGKLVARREKIVRVD